MKAKNILIALFSSVLLVFSFPNFIEKTTVVHTSFLIWIAWAPLFYLVIKAKNGKEAFFTGFSIAASFYLVSLYWLCNVKPMGNFAYVAWLLLCAYYGTLTGISAWAVRKLKGRPGIGYILSAPVIFTLAEFVREWAFSGWPVLTPAQSQHQFIPALQLLKFTGISGLNFLIFSVNVIIAMYVAGEKPVMKKFEGMAWLAIFIMLLFLTAAGNMPASVPSTTVKAALLQPNIDQNVNWDANYREYNMKIYKSLYDKVAAEKPDIYIWPETGFPGFFYMDSKGRETVGEWTGAGNYSIVGSDHMEGTRQDPKYYNSVFAVTYGGAVSGPYSKFHLVPFGEYVPFAKTIPFIRKVVQRYGYTGFTPGESVKPLAIGEHLVGPIVCFDSFFPEIARRQALQGAGFLAHLSYETWYGDTPASAQIFTNGVLRSAETGLYMVRCVASGISGFVDDRGRITAVTRLFTRDALARDIKIRKKGSLTPYTRYGEWFVWECLIVLLAACLIRYKIK